MQVVVNVPDQYLLDMNVGEIARQLKLYTALFMFQAGQLSAGAASGIGSFFFADMKHSSVHTG